MRHVIELRGIIDRPEKPGQIVEERVVTAANKDFDRQPVTRLQCDGLIGRDHRGKASAGEIEKADMGLVVAIDSHAYFGWLQYAQIFVLDGVQIRQKSLEARILPGRSHEPAVGRDQDAVEHIRIQYPGMRHCGKGQSNDDLFIARSVVARKSENVVQIGGTDVDIRENRIYRVGVIVICHDLLPLAGGLKPGRPRSAARKGSCDPAAKPDVRDRAGSASSCRG